ncbi:MAG: hypothetical protein R3E77_14740 [Steroidobacteraceae bacterium]
MQDLAVHPLDRNLSQRNLLAWFAPASRLALQHWPIVLAATALAFLAQWLASLMMPDNVLTRSVWSLILPWALEYAALTIVAVLAYAMLAGREGALHGCGRVNERPAMVGRSLEICMFWTIFAAVFTSLLILLVKLVVAMIPAIGAKGVGVLILVAVYGLIALPILTFLLAPLWVFFAVAALLSHARVARASESGVDAVLRSLARVWGQKWRILLPSYLIAAIMAVVLFALMKLRLISIVGPGTAWGLLFSSAFVGFGVALTFVIERCYAPELGMDEDYDAAADPRPSTPMRASAPAPTPAPAPAPAPAADAAASPTSTVEAAAQVAEVMLSDRKAPVAAAVEQGLALDPRFFLEREDQTVALAKRLAQERRPELALRILQPFVKEKRSHPMHLSAALLVVDLLARALKQPEPARKLLAQLRELYPGDNMVASIGRQLGLDRPQGN